jgi:hypothetical protein
MCSVVRFALNLKCDQRLKAAGYEGHKPQLRPKGVCFLRSVANQWTKFYARAITGIKLSSVFPCQGE